MSRIHDRMENTSITDLPGMIATLCSYEEHWGPCSLHTLRLAMLVAEELERIGERAASRMLLERVVRDSAHALGAGHELRMDALIRLREVCLAAGDSTRALAAQREIITHRPEKGACEQFTSWMQ